MATIHLNLAWNKKAVLWMLQPPLHGGWEDGSLSLGLSCRLRDVFTVGEFLLAHCKEPFAINSGSSFSTLIMCEESAGGR